ncbi:hypothetical protein [Reyranella sp.]|uniref:hypothetical protein n=1 Tax=Reyranella sp. TaxID=1929291 RepID=UPI00120035EA|nr:hypothetical protein [Reyranella sp.]TAJ90978.1 MAG: hypothetical protein EPO50_00140 [Reyranella sp.]
MTRETFAAIGDRCIQGSSVFTPDTPLVHEVIGHTTGVLIKAQQFRKQTTDWSRFGKATLTNRANSMIDEELKRDVQWHN